MENMITLFKAPWTQGSLNQPYFTSNTARNQYLQTLPNIILNLNKPNIKFDYGLNITIVIPLDYTKSTDYNFCQLIYNDKVYYATIEDYSLVSVGFTELKLYRHLLSERTNFFQYFENYNVDRCTLSENYFQYFNNARFFRPDFRYYKRRNNLSISGKVPTYYDAANDKVLSYVTVNDLKLFPFIVVFFTEQLTKGSKVRNLYGAETNFCCAVIPLLNQSGGPYDRFLFRCFESTGSYSYRYVNNGYDSNHYNTFLSENSAYITSVKLIQLPCDLYTYAGDDDIPEGQYYRVPFVYNTEPYDNSFLLYGLFLASTAGTLRGTICDFDYYIDREYDFPYGNAEIRFSSSDGSIIIDKSNYTNSSGNLQIRINFWYFLDPTDDMILVLVNGGSESVYGNSNWLYNSIELDDSISYTITSESNFDAQNRYYDALTRSVRNQKVVGSLFGSSSQMGVGASEFYYGNMFNSRGGQLSSYSLGTGNIIRGAESFISGITDAIFYSQQRNIMKANERNRPDEIRGGGTGLIRNFEMSDGYYEIEDIPYEDDYNNFIKEIETYGYEVDLYLDNIIVDNLLNGDYFSLKTNAIKKFSSDLNEIEYRFFYTLLTNGCRYHYIAEST